MLSNQRVILPSQAGSIRAAWEDDQAFLLDAGLILKC